MNYEITTASIRHVRPMSRHLRAAACMTLRGFGFDSRRALHRAFLQSIYCRTALIDGKPVAMWGVVAGLMSETAYVWLVISDQIANIPLSITREAKAELSKIMEHYDELAATVLPDDDAAIRFAVYLGFHDSHDGPKLSRKAREREIRENPAHRIAIGDQYVVALGYHPAERH